MSAHNMLVVETSKRAEGMNVAWQNLSDAIFQFAQERPNAPAIFENGNQLTYHEFATLIGKAAGHLHDLGVKNGEMVGISMPTNTDHVILSCAMLRIGAVPVDAPLRRPVEPDPFKQFKISRAFRSPDGPPLAVAQVHTIDANWRNAFARERGDFRYPGSLDETIHFSLTSGSTGAPKGIITTQRQWLARFQSALKLFHIILTPERPPNLLVIGEMSFSGIYFFLMNQFCIGGPVVLMGANFDPDYIVKTINGWDDSVFLMISPICRALLAKAPPEGLLFPKARALFVGAAPLFPEEKRAAVRHLSPNFYEIYGSAACGFISALQPDEAENKAESEGRIAPGIEVQIVDRNENFVPNGSIGHVRCRGPGISKSFFDAGHADTSEPEGFRSGWYYPGDIGAIDDAGYIYVKGRVSDMILRRSTEIFPQEIEQILVAHGSVAEAAVIGIPTSGSRDQQVFAFVVLRDAAKLDAIAQHCKTHIPAEKAPDRIFRVETLPKTGTGKLDRPALRSAVLRSLRERANAETKASD
jgi:acyl-coenzyme A synthetase/AMP-(fatty) acid ligase